MEDKPVVKTISRKVAKKVAAEARLRAEHFRRMAEYPKKMEDLKAREATLQIEVAQFIDQADSDLPSEELIVALENLCEKATTLENILREQEKVQKLIDGDDGTKEQGAKKGKKKAKK
jgi:hypothetical protein